MSQFQAMTTTQAPQAIGPYSQAIRHGSWLFVSGQIAIDPTSGRLIAGDIVAQTHQVMKNLTAILSVAGTDAQHIVKTTIYVTDLSAFTAVNEAYGAYFASPYPARATVQVNSLPKNALIEIDCIATIE